MKVRKGKCFSKSKSVEPNQSTKPVGAYVLSYGKEIERLKSFSNFVCKKFNVAGPGPRLLFTVQALVANQDLRCYRARSKVLIRTLIIVSIAVWIFINFIIGIF